MSTTRDTIIAAATGVSIGMILLLISAGLISFHEHKYQSQIVNQITKFQYQVVQDVGEALTTLNALKVKTCDTKTLSAMQHALFTSRFLKQIGFSQNNQLICTTSQGLLAEPISLKTQPTFDTFRGPKIWVDETLPWIDKTVPVLIAQMGHFNVVVDRTYTSIFDIPESNWQAVHRIKGNVSHVYGQKNIFENLSGDNFQQKVSWERHYSQYCLAKLGYCGAVSRTTRQILSEHYRLTSILLLLVCAISYITRGCAARFIRSRRRSISRVKQGIGKKSYYNVFQPIVNLCNEQIIGCEVLSRFKDSKGEIYPNEFIPMIKKLNLTWPFTLHMYQSALKQLSRYELPAGFKIGFNIFPEDLDQEKMHQLYAISAPYISRFNINLELIEDEVLNTADAKAILTDLRNLGFSVSIDDFGTGYSNLSHLNRLSSDFLKIDRSFIYDIESTSLGSILVPQIHTMAKKVGMRCIAEGIENRAQLEQLKSIGVEFGQGWYFGKPAILNQFIKTVKEKQNQWIAQPRRILNIA
ncbi:EAL domain-containing protein [Aliikangiella coralliicola]|uniref:cyclic-guanylate-specific phosphodiesterase n=1 Tax=Aliikangiella coralliicola TaxID=2592383 RepID=A0A545UJ31_9GAMM|nr:EAL domain-containing protein [Aliikangiella coralliicola]TQV89470.1 EAL domain-containing protein [Aliikangiella coralliicola]